MLTGSDRDLTESTVSFLQGDVIMTVYFIQTC